LRVDDPFGIDVMRGAVAFEVIAGGGLAVGGILAVASLFVRRRRADEQTHAQIRWLAYVVMTAVVVLLVTLVMAIVVGESFGSPAGRASSTAGGAFFRGRGGRGCAGHGMSRLGD